MFGKPKTAKEEAQNATWYPQKSVVKYNETYTYTPDG